MLLQAGGAVNAQLGEEHGEMLGEFPLQEEPLPHQRRSLPQEALIILALHEDIQIIVPGDEALMPHRAQERACE